ncbi:hypothetical protein PR202_gb17481 [Eleusine coracana subsp. coracana]|uniref:SHSP domain-containing protein n=1 Tax=Eleusine coracana subsp. coracana TaxID=191504 RepID=A0AAV5F308_ELECO|nr:hypothetical protein QOZ80_6BG0465770 [Eleusine coracana subsp. coracana]GJN29271.1 hypothetical protein PR202_gb17481 [Eleusine coracana subsp. coracana]
MASAVVSKGPPLAGLLGKLLAAPAVAYYALGPASVAGSRRLFNSGDSPLSRNHDGDFSGGPTAVARTGPGWWLAKDDGEEVLLKVPMPDLGKEHVKVWTDQNTLMIKGQRHKVAGEDLDDGFFVKYDRRIELPADTFKMDQVRAEMKNGLLKVTVPKVKAEECKDVFRVPIG